LTLIAELLNIINVSFLWDYLKMKFFTFLLFIPLFCQAGLEDRTYERDKTALVKMLNESIHTLPICSKGYECDNIFQIGLNGKKISIELWSDKYAETAPAVINKCVDFYFQKNKFFDIHLSIFDKQKTGSIREMVAKPVISLDLSAQQPQ
jgi:hypothetical protein